MAASGRTTNTPLRFDEMATDLIEMTDNPSSVIGTKPGGSPVAAVSEAPSEENCRVRMGYALSFCSFSYSSTFVFSICFFPPI